MNKWKDKTRGGSEVRIYSESGTDGLPIHGAVYRNLGWCIAGWDKSGRFWGGVRPEDDLIPNTPAVDWSKQPEWCEAVVKNIDGHWYRFASVPYIGNTGWFPQKDDNDLFFHAMHPSEYPDWPGDWKESLCVRPKETNNGKR